MSALGRSLPACACAAAAVLLTAIASPAAADVVFAPVELPAPGSSTAVDLAVGDFDEDGHADLVYPGSSPKLWLGDGAGGLTPVALPVPTLPAMVDVGDFDGDGHLDIVAI